MITFKSLNFNIYKKLYNFYVNVSDKFANKKQAKINGIFIYNTSNFYTFCKENFKDLIEYEKHSKKNYFSFFKKKNINDN